MCRTPCGVVLLSVLFVWTAIAPRFLVVAHPTCSPMRSGARTTFCTQTAFVTSRGPKSLLFGTARIANAIQKNAADCSTEDDLSKQHNRTWVIPSPGGLSGEIFESRSKPYLTSAQNATLPLALMVFDPGRYATPSQSRRAIRRGQIFIQRNGGDASVGFAGSRVYPGDYIVEREAAERGATDRFLLPVVYEDDHMAIVNKPSGMVLYKHTESVLDMLPRVLNCSSSVTALPKVGEVLPHFKPAPVHRLDAATCGLLVIAKTKAAAVNLAEQFGERRVAEKMYTAILNGNPADKKNVDESENGGVSKYSDDGWNKIDHPLEGKPALTLWRGIATGPSQNANNNTVTVVQFRPQHGRKHQLRRHASEVLQCPIVGDTRYDKDGKLRPRVGRRIFLCANEVVLDHPYYNTDEGRRALFEKHADERHLAEGGERLNDENEERELLRVVRTVQNVTTVVFKTPGGSIKLQASVNPPNWFGDYVSRENERMIKYEDWMKRNEAKPGL